MTDEDKWLKVQAHFEKSYRVKFQAKPKAEVINYLFAELQKFQQNLNSLLHHNPELEQKTDLSVGQKICKSRKPRLLVLENLANIHPDEFIKI